MGKHIPVDQPHAGAVVEPGGSRPVIHDLVILDVWTGDYRACGLPDVGHALPDPLCDELDEPAPPQLLQEEEGVAAGHAQAVAALDGLHGLVARDRSHVEDPQTVAHLPKCRHPLVDITAVLLHVGGGGDERDLPRPRL